MTLCLLLYNKTKQPTEVKLKKKKMYIVNMNYA